MMTIRCRSRFSTLLFCLPLGLCVASTTWAASDDDEEWKETKGPRSGDGADDDSDSDDKADRSSDDEDSAKKDSDEDSSDKSSEDEDSGSKRKRKRKGKAKFKADSSSSASTVSLAVLGSYGFSEALSPGVGLRGGVHLDGVIPLYVGGLGEFFFGTQSVTNNFGKKTTTTRRFMYFGAEAGIDVEATKELLLRPMFGLGLGFDTNKTLSESSGDTGDTSLHPVLTPGIVGLYSLGSTFFIGLDFRYLIIPGASATSGPVISATLGLKF